MYRTIKAIKPDADVGWHVDHQPSSWDLVYRAEMSYAEMAPYSDFIKFIAYHDVLGPRIRYWYLDRFQKTILGEVPLTESHFAEDGLLEPVEIPVADARPQNVVVGDELDEVGVGRHLGVAHFGAIYEVPTGGLVI